MFRQTLPTAVEMFRYKSRKALREILACSLVAALAISLKTANLWANGIASGLVLAAAPALLIGPCIWIAYRLTRFVIGR